MLKVSKPWGHEFRVYLDEKVDVWLMCFKAGNCSSLHFHPNKDKFLCVVAGEATLIKDNIHQRAKQGDTQFIPKGMAHRQIAHTDALILETEWPPDKRDIVRLEDSYGRKGKPYEPYDGE